MISDGSPWRPLVHVEDICEAIVPRAGGTGRRGHGKIFNVGQNSENYRVREIAEIVADEFPGLRGDGRPAERRQPQLPRDVRQDRTASCPASSAARPPATAREQLRALFERIEMSPETYEFRAFTRLKQLKYLQRTGQIDDDFFWR